MIAEMILFKFDQLNHFGKGFLFGKIILMLLSYIIAYKLNPYSRKQ